MDNITLQNLRDNLSALASNAKFVGLTYTSKETGEQARHTIIVGVNYETLVRKSIISLETMFPLLDKANVLRLQAFNEVRLSLTQSLACLLDGTKNPDYTCADTYLPVCAGLKLNLNDGILHISGLAHTKVVLIPGLDKPDNRRPLTVQKDSIRRELPIGKWRQFRVSSENLHLAKLNGETLEF